jgi:membrane protease YdiL (CAAX protease family)
VTGLVLILGFPLLLAVGFGGVYAVAYGLGRGREALDRAGIFLYPVFLSVPFGVALAAAERRGVLLRLGLAPPEFAALPPAAALVVGLAAGAVCGVALFRGEVALARALARWTRGRKRLGKLVEGKTAALAEAPPLPAPVLAAVTLYIVLAEEFLWRGYLVDFLHVELALPAAAAIAVAAAAFGLNHYYFGLRSVAGKAVAGAVWSLLVLGTGSLVPAFAGHFVFDLLAWRSVRR